MGRLKHGGNFVYGITDYSPRDGKSLRLNFTPMGSQVQTVAERELEERWAEVNRHLDGLKTTNAIWIAIWNANQPKGARMYGRTVEAQNHVDGAGNPAGGWVVGSGFDINWQNGPLGRGRDRVEPNGAFVCDVIEAALLRLEFFQTSKFKCRENAIAITKLEEALLWLGKRRADREARGVEGTQTV